MAVAHTERLDKEAPLSTAKEFTSLLLMSASAALFAVSPALAQQVTEQWRLEGFSTPESVLLNEATNELIVGNMVTCQRRSKNASAGRSKSASGAALGSAFWRH